MTKGRYPKTTGRKAPKISEPAVVETTVFRSGNSDAVRLPKRFGLLGKPVRVRRLADDRILIETRRTRGWPAGFFESFGNIPDDFVAPERPVADPRDAARADALFHDVD